MYKGKYLRYFHDIVESWNKDDNIHSSEAEYTFMEGQTDKMNYKEDVH